MMLLKRAPAQGAVTAMMKNAVMRNLVNSPRNWMALEGGYKREHKRMEVDKHKSMLTQVLIS